MSKHREMNFFDGEHITFRLLQMSPTYREAYLESWAQIHSLHPARETTLITSHPLTDYNALPNITIETTQVSKGSWPFLITLPEQILETSALFVVEILALNRSDLLDPYEVCSARVLNWASPRIMVRTPGSIGFRPIYSFEEILELEKVDELSSCMVADTARFYQDDSQVSLWATNVCPYAAGGMCGYNMFNLPYILFSNRWVAHLYVESLDKVAKLMIKET